jgi:hypothetical protein
MEIVERIKKKLDEGKQIAKYRDAARKQIQSKARAAAYKEREKQAIRYAQQREKMLIDKKLESLKKSPALSFIKPLDIIGTSKTSKERFKVI